jgi:hypothetical protein
MLLKKSALALAACTVPVLGALATPDAAQASGHAASTAGLVNCGDPKTGHWSGEILDGVALTGEAGTASVDLRFKVVNGQLTVDKAQGTDWAGQYDLESNAPLKEADNTGSRSLFWGQGTLRGVKITDMQCDSATGKVKAAHVHATAPFAYNFDAQVTDSASAAGLVACGDPKTGHWSAEILDGVTLTGNAGGAGIELRFKQVAAQITVDKARGTDGADQYSLQPTGSIRAWDDGSLDWGQGTLTGVRITGMQCDSATGKVKTAHVRATAPFAYNFDGRVWQQP